MASIGSVTVLQDSLSSGILGGSKRVKQGEVRNDYVVGELIDTRYVPISGYGKLVRTGNLCMGQNDLCRQKLWG